MMRDITEILATIPCGDLSLAIAGKKIKTLVANKYCVVAWVLLGMCLSS